MSELEMHSPGSSIPLSSVVIDAVILDYRDRDAGYQRALAAQAANPALDITRDKYRVGERTRKRIERAMRDLVEIGAVIRD